MSDVLYLSNAEGNLWIANYLVNGPTWLALHDGEPGPDVDETTEILGGGYKRQSIDFGAPAAQGTVNTNGGAFSGMPACTLRWMSVWNQRYNGRMRFALKFPAPVIVAGGGQWLFAPGDVAFGL